MGAMSDPAPSSTRPPRRRSPLPAAALALGVAALVTAGFVLGGCRDRSAFYASMDGEALYRQACLQCHGPQGKGTASAPSYRGIRDDWTAERLLLYIDDPAAFKRTDLAPRHLRGSEKYMQPVDFYMPPDARERLVEYALGLMDELRVDDPQPAR